MEQTVFHGRVGDLDMVGQLEAALEGAAGNAAMEIGRLVIVLSDFAFDGQCIVFDGDVDVFFAEPGDGKGNLVAVLRCFDDVLGRIRDTRVVKTGY